MVAPNSEDVPPKTLPAGTSLIRLELIEGGTTSHSTTIVAGADSHVKSACAVTVIISPRLGPLNTNTPLNTHTPKPSAKVVALRKPFIYNRI